ncbi:MAG: hypothetical protein LBU36_01645 [Clostridiales bacterium]|jgi:methyl-accepting chemotaxis protein|nr:hypothetical protein [Clostridiales bacterium]
MGIKAKLTTPYVVLSVFIAGFSSYMIWSVAKISQVAEEGANFTEIIRLCGGVNTMFIIFISVCAVTLLAGIFSIDQAVARPVRDLVEMAASASSGATLRRFDYYGDDEFARIGEELKKIGDTTRQISYFLDKLYSAVKRGAPCEKSDVFNLGGVFDVIMLNIEEIGSLVEEREKALASVLNDLRNGALAQPSHPVSGEAGSAARQLAEYLKHITAETASVARTLKDGNFSARLSAGSYAGDFSAIPLGFNLLADKTAEFTGDMAESLRKMSKAEFDAPPKGEYGGDFQRAREALRDAGATLASFTEETLRVLSEVENKNYGAEMSKSYPGHFSQIKDGLNSVIRQLRESGRPAPAAPAFISRSAPPAERLSSPAKTGRLAASKPTPASGAASLNKSKTLSKPIYIATYDVDGFGKY